MSGDARRYHHGDLRRAVLEVTVEAIAQDGPSGVRLRDVARRAGVAHTSVTHHFGDKAGLLSAVAAEGYRRLGEELRAAAEQESGGFLEQGVAYVRFAVRNPSHFAVMFRPELYRDHDPELDEARSLTRTMLYRGASEIADEPGDQMVPAVAGWSLVHGLATLWLGGNLPAELGDDPEQLTRVVAARLGGGSRRGRRPAR